MDIQIYMHNGCPSFARSANDMLTHLRTSHPSSVTPLLLSSPSGLEQLDSQLSEHLLSLSPPGTLTHVCLSCNIVLGTRFQATEHLTLPQHTEEYQLALRHAGQAGIKALLTPRWMTTIQDSETTHVLAPPEPGVEPNALSASAGQLRVLQSFYDAGQSSVALSPKVLRLIITDYTTRSRFPAKLDLRVIVPRTTCTVRELALCVETAFVADSNGEPGVIDWARLIAVYAVVFDADVTVIRRDEDVVVWMAKNGTGEQTGVVKRRVW